MTNSFSRWRTTIFSAYLLALGSVAGAIAVTCCIAGFVPGVLRYWGFPSPAAAKISTLVLVIAGAMIGAYIASLVTAELRRKAALQEEKQPKSPEPTEDTRPDWLKGEGP